MYVQVGECTLWVNVLQPSSTPSADSSTAQHPTTPPQWILLMHGFPDTAALWQEQIPALSAAGYGVVAPDMPGYGRSRFHDPQHLQQYTLRSIVAVMCGLLDALCIAKVTAVGHDWGAAVAWAFALQAPERLSRLVVLSVGHPGGGAAVDPRQRAHWWYQLFFCLPGAEAAVTANGWALFRQIMGASVSQQQLEAYVQALSQPGALSSALNWYRANTHPRHFGATAPLPSPTRLLSVPTLGVWSSADTALLEAQMTASSRYVAPGCWQYVRLEGVGHWIARDAPQQLNRVLLGFLGTPPGVQQGQQPEGAAGPGHGGEQQQQQQQVPRARL